MPYLRSMVALNRPKSHRGLVYEAILKMGVTITFQGE